jgi:hypothetical protein
VQFAFYEMVQLLLLFVLYQGKIGTKQDPSPNKRPHDPKKQIKPYNSMCYKFKKNQLLNSGMECLRGRVRSIAIM